MFIIFAFNSFDIEGHVTMHTGTERTNIHNSVAVWGSVSGHGQMVREISGRLDTVQYKRFLRDAINFYATESALPLKYVHDRYPVHHAATIKKWIQDNQSKIEMVPWPAAFGDVMPLERIWEDLLKMLNEPLREMKNTNQLWREIETSWPMLLTNDYVNNLLTSIPTLLQKIIDNDGNLVR